jgi:glycosyltransferase involved in cell wall biosynthesis
MTLKVVESLSRDFQIDVFDYATNSVFLSRLGPSIRASLHLPLINPFGRSKGRMVDALTALISLYAGIRAVVEYARRENIADPLIYAATTKTLALAYALSLIKGFRYVFHAHLIYRKASPFYWILRPAFISSALILCVSRAVMEQLPGKRRLLYNAIELPEARPRRLTDEKVVVAAFSRLVKIKGIRYFMESHRFIERPDKVEYRVYGDGPERDNLKCFQNKHVRLMGFAENTQDILKNEVSLVVIPSLIAESFGMTMIEAFSFGVPVIGTNKGGLAELLKDGKVGFLVPPKNPAAIAKKIDYFIDHPDVYEEFSTSALEYVKQFDLEKYKKTVRGIFKSL